MLIQDPFSEDHIRAHCSHCDPTSNAFADLLDETENFRIVCDHHSLCEGHILIIPKEHLSCIGAYSEKQFDEFVELYELVSAFLKKEYGSVSSFEHGNIGQTVFHSHVHLLPYAGDPLTIVPEGKEHLVALPSFIELQKLFKHYDRYLFFSMNDLAWVVDPTLASPGFFRNRFATALGNAERGNWKEMDRNQELMTLAQADNAQVKKRWEGKDKK